MNKTLLILILIIVQLTTKENNKDSIIVTYISNCGFMVEIDSTKIIIDGLYRDGLNRYDAPDSIISNTINKGLEPFDNIDYIFITHKHADHFDAQTVTDFMLNNSKSKLISPKQVIDILKEYPDKYKQFESRVIECTPEVFNSKNIKLGNLDIMAYRLIHANKKNSNIENIAYRISCNNKTIFHTGDADPNQTDKYLGTLPSDKKIDIAFINSAFGNYKNFQITNKIIGADKNIAMHFPKYFFKIEHEKAKVVPDYFKEPIVFKELMESKVIYTTTKE